MPQQPSNLTAGQPRATGRRHLIRRVPAGRAATGAGTRSDAAIRDTVVVLTSAKDTQADVLVAELRSRPCEVVRLDLSVFPVQASLTAGITDGQWTGGLYRDHTRVLNVQRVRAVYYGTATLPRIPDHVLPQTRMFLTGEATAALHGLLASLPPGVVRINDPDRRATADLLPVQLATAARCGLPVPATLLTNDIDDVLIFGCTLGVNRVVHRSLTPSALDIGAVSLLGHTSATVDPSDLDPATFSATARLIQQPVPDGRRVTLAVIGRHHLAVAAKAANGTGWSDWLALPDWHSYTRIPTPDRIVSAARRYLRELGLSFGVFTFTITTDHEWIMLGCDPGASWLWLQHEAGLPIGAALADVLAGTTGPR